LNRCGEFLNGGSGYNGHVTDTSVAEAAPASDAICDSKCLMQMGSHDEQVRPITNEYVPDIDSTIAAVFGSFNFNVLHHYQMLWVPMAQNAGTGIMSWYIDDHQS
jgi:hypothetical protein